MFDTTSDITDTRTAAARVEAWETRSARLKPRSPGSGPARSSCSASWTATRWMPGRGCAPWATGCRPPRRVLPDRQPVVATGQSRERAVDTLMADGRCGLDVPRSWSSSTPPASNKDQLGDAVATRFSLGRLYGLLERVRSFTAEEERTGFEHRYLVIQPTLDDAAYKLWGLLPGVDGQVISPPSTAGNRVPVLPGEGNGRGSVAPTPSPPSASTPSPAPTHPDVTPGR